MFMRLRKIPRQIMNLLYHPSRRSDRLQAFKHQKLQHCGVLSSFRGEFLLMFDTTNLLVQSTSSIASSAWLLRFRESFYLDGSGKYALRLFCIHTKTPFQFGASFRAYNMIPSHGIRSGFRDEARNSSSFPLLNCSFMWPLKSVPRPSFGDGKKCFVLEEGVESWCC